MCRTWHTHRDRHCFNGCINGMDCGLDAGAGDNAKTAQPPEVVPASSHKKLSDRAAMISSVQ